MYWLLGWVRGSDTSRAKEEKYESREEDAVVREGEEGAGHVVGPSFLSETQPGFLVLGG